MARYHRDTTKIENARHPGNKKAMPTPCACGNQYPTQDDREICELSGHRQPRTGKGVD